MNLKLSEWLREETAKEHAKTEEMLSLGKSLTSRESYRKLLEIFLSVFDPAERRIAELGVWRFLGFSAGGAARVARLRRDIEFLGGTPTSLTEFTLIQSLDEAIGCAYVLEGSRLGGKLIAAQARLRLGLTSEGVSFFADTPEERHRTWAAFRSALDRLQGVSHDAVKRGALVTFRQVRKSAGGALG